MQRGRTKAKTELDKNKTKAAEALTSAGIEFEIADRLVAFGLVSPEAFEGVTAEDLVGLGFEDSVAQDILTKVSVDSDDAQVESPVTEEGDALLEEVDEGSSEESAPQDEQSESEEGSSSPEDDSSSEEEEG